MKNELVTITVAFLFCSTLVAQDTEFSRSSLKGLTGVEVLVEPLDPDAEKDGLLKDQIQTDVEPELCTETPRMLPGCPLGCLTACETNLPQ